MSKKSPHGPKPGPKPGNRILNDPEIKEKIYKWVTTGLLSREECAKRLGVESSTLCKEIQLDPEFGRRLQEGETDIHDELVTAMMRHGKEKDWRAIWTMLTSKWGTKWNRKESQFSVEDFQIFALRMSDLVRKYVPDTAQIQFAAEVESILRTMENTKRKEEKLPPK